MPLNEAIDTDVSGVVALAPMTAETISTKTSGTVALFKDFSHVYVSRLHCHIYRYCTCYYKLW